MIHIGEPNRIVVCNVEQFNCAVCLISGAGSAPFASVIKSVNHYLTKFQLDAECWKIES